MHGVERDDAVCKIDFLKKILRRRNLVGFLVDFDMRQHKRAVGGEGAQNLPRLGVGEGVEAFLERLAVERQSANAGNGLVIVDISGDLLQLVSERVAILESDKGDFLADIGRMLSESLVYQTSVGESDYQRFNQRDLRRHHGFRSAWREALRGGRRRILRGAHPARATKAA